MSLVDVGQKSGHTNDRSNEINLLKRHILQRN